MSLFATLAKLQRNAAKVYLKLSQHFSGNEMVRHSWAAMAQDMEQQTASLRALGPTFWKQLKSQERRLKSVIGQTASFVNHAVPHDPVGWSLHDCLMHSLDFEDPLIRGVYPPLIYRLRKERTDHGLDFYIRVNAHLTRLARLIQSTSGDPFLVKRCGELLQQFEKATQAPESEPASSPRKKGAKKAVGRASVARRVSRKTTEVRARALKARPPKAAPVLSKRAKPLLKNIKLARRRARR